MTKFNDDPVKISNYSWIVDGGIDSERKTSVFWDFVRDDYMCPMCALVYSCMPLGFNVYTDQFSENKTDTDSLRNQAKVKVNPDLLR